MLAYVLAIAVGLSSLFLFTTAFVAKDTHRKDDFLWSAVGLFYALVLWVCARRITGAVLLGQTAAAILILSFGWQALQLREAVLFPDRRKDVLNFSVIEWLQNRSGMTPRNKPKQSVPSVTEPPIIPQIPEPVETVTPLEPVISDATTTIQDTAETISDNLATAAREVEEIFPDEEVEEPFFPQTGTTPEEPPVIQPPIVNPPVEQSKAKKGFSFKNLFGFRNQSKPTPKVTPVPESIIEELDDFDTEVEGREIVGEGITEASASVTPSAEEFEPAENEFAVETPPKESEPEVESIEPTETAFREETTSKDSESEQDFESFFSDPQAETIIDTPPPFEETIEPSPVIETISYEEIIVEVPRTGEDSSDELVIDTFKIVLETSEVEETTGEDTVNELKLREEKLSEESRSREEQSEKPFDS